MLQWLLGLATLGGLISAYCIYRMNKSWYSLTTNIYQKNAMICSNKDGMVLYDFIDISSFSVLRYHNRQVRRKLRNR